MTTHEFNNQASQAERKAIVKNDSYFARQSNTADDAGGRYAKLTPATITGATPTPKYPQLPASSPWSQFDQNVEPVLGFSVDAMEPVGTQAEIEASIPTLKPPEVSALPATVEDRVGERVVSVVSSPLSTQATRSHSMKRRNW